MSEGSATAEPFFILRRIYLLRNITDCINAFLPLLHTRYEIILGRKEVATNLKITFDKKDCFHLIGLQYLIDRPELNRDREKVFDEIATGIIPTNKLVSSDYYYKIEERIHYLPLLETILDSNDTIFKYNKKSNIYSMIDADYLMKNNIENRNMFLFLSKNVDDTYFFRSFFPENKRDYTKNQASWTLLFKKKVNTETKNEIILYNKLKNI